MGYTQQVAALTAKIAATRSRQLAAAKQKIILDALERAGGNRTRAARNLGISRQYLHALLTALAIRSPRLSQEQRRAITRKAALARWRKRSAR